MPWRSSDDTPNGTAPARTATFWKAAIVATALAASVSLAQAPLLFIEQKQQDDRVESIQADLLEQRGAVTARADRHACQRDNKQDAIFANFLRARLDARPPGEQAEEPIYRRTIQKLKVDNCDVVTDELRRVPPPG